MTGECHTSSRHGRSATAWSYALLLFAGGIWGVTYSLAKLATEQGAHPLGINLWQTFFGAGFLLVFVLSRRQKLPFDRAHLSFYLVCGLLGTVLPGTLSFYAARYLPAGILSITIATVPMMTYLLAFALQIDRLSPARVLGVALGVLAVVFIAAPRSSLPNPEAAPWVLAAVIAAACYAGENLYIALRRPSGTEPGTLLLGMFLCSLAIMGPLAIATGSFVSFAWPWGQVELSIVAMAAINVVSYGLFVYLVTRSGPVFASQMAYVVTLSGVFWGIAIFSEQHSGWVWGALGLMMAGLALVKPRDPA